MVITVDIRQLVQATKDAIGDADKALSGMRILEEWKGVVGNIQWVMDTVGDLAQVFAPSVIPDIFLTVLADQSLCPNGMGCTVLNSKGIFAYNAAVHFCSL